MRRCALRDDHWIGSARSKKETIVPAESVRLAIGMLTRGEIDLCAANKPTLFEMSDATPNARILDGKLRP